MKRIAKVLTSILAGSFALSACGPNPAEQDYSEPRINIDVPLDDVRPGELKQAIVDLAKMSQADAKTKITFDELLNTFRLPDEIAPYADLIVSSRSKVVDIQCQGLTCVGESTGRRIQFKLEDVDIPVLGSPIVIIEPTIRINYRFNNELNLLEACSISGIRLRSGFITQNLDGALIQLDKNDEPETVLVDIGVGGTYPSRGCDFK